tara:strand:- start:1272 stop:1418 length:147 start_codon:yes stop_codon:yes gene_type:complete
MVQRVSMTTKQILVSNLDQQQFKKNKISKMKEEIVTYKFQPIHSMLIY